MKDFVLFRSSEMPHIICKENFEKYTKNEFPFKQIDNGNIHFYATCPECENPIQIKGLYNGKRVYGAHTGKNIKGLNEFNYLNYKYCPRAVKGSHVPKDERKELSSQKDITVYKTIRNNFDLAVAFAKKHLGYYISNNKAKEALDAYYESQGWLYPHSSVNNIPFMLFYLQPAFNPYGLWIRKGGLLEKKILEVKDFELQDIEGNAGMFYRRLVTKSGGKYLKLTMMLWNHRFKENDNGNLEESIDIQICKDLGLKPEIHEWKEIINVTIKIPELDFSRFINSNKNIRDKDLLEYSNKLFKDF